jgi:hypothetical protein
MASPSFFKDLAAVTAAHVAAGGTQTSSADVPTAFSRGSEMTHVDIIKLHLPKTVVWLLLVVVVVAAAHAWRMAREQVKEPHWNPRNAIIISRFFDLTDDICVHYWAVQRMTPAPRKG